MGYKIYLIIKNQNKTKLNLITSTYNPRLLSSIPLYLVCISAPSFDETQRAINSAKSLTDHRLYH